MATAGVNFPAPTVAQLAPTLHRRTSFATMTIRSLREPSTLPPEELFTIRLPPTPLSERKLPEKRLPEFAVVGGDDRERLKVDDFFERSKEMIKTAGGGGARWFTPLECQSTSRLERAPTLLYLPGIDGIGLGLIRQNYRMKNIFDIWCLHIPIADRTSFKGLVVYVEKTLRSINLQSQQQPIYLLGESLGACLAYAVAARNPDIDLMIITVNPATSFCKSLLQTLLDFSDGLPELLVHDMMPKLLKFTDNSLWTSIDYAEKNLQQSIRGLPESAAIAFSYLTFLANTLPKEARMWKLKMLKSASLYANSRLHAIKSQVLIIASGNDKLFPSGEEAERIRKSLTNCRIRFCRGSDHTVLLESDFDIVPLLRGACFYRRSRQVNLVSDYLLPTSGEFEKAMKPCRLFLDAASTVFLSTLDGGKIARGFDGIPPEGPVIFVGNHMLWASDSLPLSREFWDRNKIYPRGLGHRSTFDQNTERILPDPSFFDLSRTWGSVPVTAANFYNLLAGNHSVMLFPGGIREACHRKGEQYKLFWPENPEFIRMAAKFGAKIVPFGGVGEDDMFELLFDYDDFNKIPYHEVLLETLNRNARLRGNATGTVKNQDFCFPLGLPKIPGRMYFLFAKAIETEGRQKELKNKKAAQELYLHIKSDVEHCLVYLKEKREIDPYRNIFARLIYQATHGSADEIPTFDF